MRLLSYLGFLVGAVGVYLALSSDRFQASWEEHDAAWFEADMKQAAHVDSLLRRIEECVCDG